MVKGTAAWLSPAAMYSPVVPAGTKVSEFVLGRWESCDLCMAFVCHALACQHLHVIRLWRGSGCGAFHGPLCRHDITCSDRQIGNISVTYITLIPWWREWSRYVPMPQYWTIAGCQGHVLGSSAENLMSGCTCRLFIPMCMGSGSGMQNPLAIFIGVFS